MRGAIHVAVSTDAAFAMQTAVVLSSLRKAGADQYVVHVLHDGLDDELRARISVAGGGAVELEWVDASAHDWGSFRVSTSVSSAVLYRLKIAELLPDLDRVIYLDADTLVLSPLRPLWEEDLEGRPIAAVLDIGFPSFAGIIAWRDLGLEPDARYFNSGVLAIDLDRWRELDVGAQALELGARHYFRLRDQCALNVACVDDWHRVPARWNVQRGHFWTNGPPWAIEGSDAMTDALADPAVMHFCRPRWNRPWLVECDHPYRDRWFEALDTTPWKGWRPPKRPLHTRAYRTLRHVRRALLDDPDRSPWS